MPASPKYTIVGKCRIPVQEPRSATASINNGPSFAQQEHRKAFLTAHADQHVQATQPDDFNENIDDDTMLDALLENHPAELQDAQQFGRHRSPESIRLTPSPPT